MPVGMPEFADNREPRCPVILLLDTSGSMDGSPISALNQGIRLFKEEVEDDDTASLRVEVAIITFGGSVNLVQDFVTIDDFITSIDGAPTDSWQYAAQNVSNADRDKQLIFFAVGVGGADFNTLEQITSTYPPVKLDGLKFKEMFKWLSNSMKKVSSSRVGGQTSLDPIGAWATVPT